MSRRGVDRTTNEDCLLDAPQAGLFAVADGVGGVPGGEIASAIAIACLRTRVGIRSSEESPDEVLRTLVDAFMQANTAILAEAGRTGTHSQTTLTAVVMHGSTLCLAHCGDSRAYRITTQGIEQLTQDHTLVADMARQGLLSEEEARLHPRRNLLSGCLGLDERFRLQTDQRTLQAGEVLVLCTDGLGAALSADEMAACVTRATAPGPAVTCLIDRALAKGSTDDLSVVVVKLAP